jgi:ubiquinone/menaquinone biosynthesis C-methylase UbiE
VKKPLQIYHGANSFESRHLDFGVGNVPRNPFRCSKLFTLDISNSRNYENHYVIKKGESLPFSDNFFDSVSAYDVLEHLSREMRNNQNEFIYYMNEICRVLKPGGFAVFVFPSIPNSEVFSDPTHVNFITKNTINYFLGNNYENGYAGIKTQYVKIINSKLRFFEQWVESDELFSSSIAIKRKISLLKRKVLRILNPSHRIWVLQKFS